MIGRRTFLGLAICCWSAVAIAAPQHVTTAERPLARPASLAAISDPLERLIARGRVSGETSAVLVDMATGAVVAAFNPDRPMPPASVTKVATSLFAFDRLGMDYSFATRVLATGPVSGGMVQGDLVLDGGGDPALDSDELAVLVKALRDKGIRGVTGRFIYYADRLPNLRQIDGGQPPNAGYNPGVSGLNLNFNRVYFEWKPEGGQMDLSLQARAEAHSPKVAGMSVVAANRAVPVYQYSEKGGADHWSIASGALQKPGGVWLPVRAPAAYTAEVFRTLAHHYGLTLPVPRQSTRPVAGAELARFSRRELKLVARGMLHFSTNLTAEVLGLSASGARSLEASGQAMSQWLAMTYSMPSAHFRDHSGLGDDNRVSAGDMARLVAQAGRRGLLEGILRRHFVAKPGGGKNGFEGVEVRAKTGTLNFVRGLAGLIEGRGGRRLAFAIFSADLAARARTDGRLERPPGTKTFNTRAVALEQAILADWIARFAI